MRKDAKLAANLSHGEQRSIRENEARTRAIGYHVERYKIVSVMLSASSSR